MKYLGNPQSGSQANTTASHNRAGQYFRNRRTPVNTVGTGRRAVIRSAFGAAAKYYASLTGAEQAAWQSYAGMYPITDSLGQVVVLTGQQMCVSINTQMQNVGLAMEPLPPSSNATTAVILTSFTAVHAGAITLTLDGSGSADDFVLVAFSAPQSSGTSFCKTFWQQSVQAADTATAIVVTTDYNAQFGSPQAGQRIFYRLTPVNEFGVTGTPLIGYSTVS